LQYKQLRISNLLNIISHNKILMFFSVLNTGQKAMTKINDIRIFKKMGVSLIFTPIKAINQPLTKHN